MDENAGVVVQTVERRRLGAEQGVRTLRVPDNCRRTKPKQSKRRGGTSMRVGKVYKKTTTHGEPGWH